MAASLSPCWVLPAPLESPLEVGPDSLRLRRRCLPGVGLAPVGVPAAGAPAGHTAQIIYAQQHGKSWRQGACQAFTLSCSTGCCSAHSPAAGVVPSQTVV